MTAGPLVEQDLDELLPVSLREHRLVCAATACAVVTPAAWAWWDTATALLLTALLAVLLSLVVQSVLRTDPWRAVDELLETGR